MENKIDITIIETRYVYMRGRMRVSERGKMGELREIEDEMDNRNTERKRDSQTQRETEKERQRKKDRERKT